MIRTQDVGCHHSVRGYSRFPEQAANRGSVDPRSDIYSLGAVGYFLLSGHPPFEGSAMRQRTAHQEQPVPPLSAPGRDVPADLEAVIMRCLEKDPARRFQDLDSLEKALAECDCAHAWTTSDRHRWWSEHPVEDLSLSPDPPPPPLTEKIGKG
jgi:eukaryotic-like serine/threonine-protein kinase